MILDPFRVFSPAASHSIPRLPVSASNRSPRSTRHLRLTQFAELNRTVLCPETIFLFGSIGDKCDMAATTCGDKQQVGVFREDLFAEWVKWNEGIICGVDDECWDSDLIDNSNTT